jgi:hypothetical protein
MDEALMRVVCPHCEQHIELSAQAAGEKINCPTCGEEFAASGAIIPPKRNSFAKRSAILSVWSPFAAFIFTCVLMASLSNQLEQKPFLGKVVIGIGGLLALVGVVFASFALAASGQIGRRGIFGRALFGLISNGLVALAAFCGIAALVKLEGDIERLKAQHPAPGKVTFEAASARLTRTEKTLERMANSQSGDAALVSKASIEFLKQLKSAGDDYAAKTKLLNDQLAAGLSGARSQEELRSRETETEQFIAANDLFGHVSENRNEMYREELIKAGVSQPSLETAMKAFSATTKPHQKPWDANRDLAQAQLNMLRFLDTNWGKWSYAESNNVVKFDTTSLSRQYEALSRDVAQAHQELRRLQSKPAEQP